MRKALTCLVIILGTILSACQPITEATEQPESSVTQTIIGENPDLINIRVVVLPLIDTLPIYIAEKEGLFKNHGIKIEFIPVASAPERDQVLLAGQADVTVNEILSDMFMNKDEIKMVVVRYAHMATPSFAHFFILASSQSGITSVENLKNVEIGISQGTIIEYVTDRLLEAKGFSVDQIKTISVPKMPERMSLLASGGIKAGVLPDPLAALAVQQGAVIVFDDAKHPSYGASVISFTKAFIENDPAAVKGFLAAIEEATLLVNSDPSKFASMLSDYKLVPVPLLGSYKIPEFPLSGITSESEWEDALMWAKEKGLLAVDISYSDSVNSTFLP